MSQKFKRRNYFIKKNFQGKMILGLFLFVIGSIVLFAALLAVFSGDSMTISYENNTLQMGQTPMMLLKNALAANWVFLIFGGSLVVIAGLFLSHRIAGPQYRFEKTLQSMIDGNLSDTIRLRSHDEGSVLATQINLFNEQLSRKIRQVEQHSSSVGELIRMMEQEGEGPLDKEYLLEKLYPIRKHNDAIRRVAAFYTLVDE